MDSIPFLWVLFKPRARVLSGQKVRWLWAGIQSRYFDAGLRKIPPAWEEDLASEVACLWDGETGGGSSEASPQDQSLPEKGGTKVRWAR